MSLFKVSLVITLFCLYAFCMSEFELHCICTVISNPLKSQANVWELASSLMRQFLRTSKYSDAGRSVKSSSRERNKRNTCNTWSVHSLAVLKPGVKLQYKERVLTLEVCTTSQFWNQVRRNHILSSSQFFLTCHLPVLFLWWMKKIEHCISWVSIQN